MNRTCILYSLIFLFAVFVSSISQILLKKAALKTYDSFLKEYLNPYVVTAYVLFFMASIIVIFAYRYVPLSMGPVLETTSYIYVALYGVKLFGEQLNSRKIIALCVIIMGILIYALGG